MRTYFEEGIIEPGIGKQHGPVALAHEQFFVAQLKIDRLDRRIGHMARSNPEIVSLHLRSKEPIHGIVEQKILNSTLARHHLILVYPGIHIRHEGALILPIGSDERNASANTAAESDAFGVYGQRFFPFYVAAYLHVENRVDIKLIFYRIDPKHALAKEFPSQKGLGEFALMMIDGTDGIEGTCLVQLFDTKRTHARMEIGSGHVQIAFKFGILGMVEWIIVLFLSRGRNNTENRYDDGKKKSQAHNEWLGTKVLHKAFGQRPSERARSARVE